ncbi:MAG: ATP-binding protein [Proteobacteria bacterium]|nr:ATP-binding protein [Pseudomonadota bacterium]
MAKQPWIRSLQSASKAPSKGLKSLPELFFPHLLQTYSFSFKTLEEAADLAAYLSSFYPQSRQHRVELGLIELFLNAIEHGNLGIDYGLKSQLKKNNCWEKEIKHRLTLPAHQDKMVSVCLDINPAYILLTIKDCGVGFNWREFNDRHPSSTTELHGRGITMAKELCFDKLSFSEKGNEVSCTVYTLRDLPRFSGMQ